ncbi:hypothetical protein [Arenimonas fontis]|uniref:Uncharacterized protein n=1 Tax=Arenimonas fontis TaxID=2608255 RepID=A0A5B2ZC01_9GAMM|nr:hypothetical protein [Arenimonas fontis]KAA2285517.1 hypothetical protein F0415_02445 [Arenimonas fontis]
MNTPQDPRTQPLAGEEAELARVLRALPAGEPPARVDAAILRAATDAAAGRDGGRPVPSRRRLPAWALGTAAAAVLAVFVGGQLRPALSPAPRELIAEARHEPLPPVGAAGQAPVADDPGADLPDLPVPPPPPPAPRAPSPGTAATPEAVATGDRIAPAAAQDDVTAAADPADVHRGGAERQAARTEERRHAAAAASTADTAAKAELEAAAKAAAETVELRKASAFRQAEAVAVPTPLADEGAPTDAGAAPPTEPPAPAPERARAAVAAPSPLPPVADDRLLPPEAWLERIRERLHAGDEAGARASLVLLRRAHPDLVIPPDLAGLER